MIDGATRGTLGTVCDYRHVRDSDGGASCGDKWREGRNIGPLHDIGAVHRGNSDAHFGFSGRSRGFTEATRGVTASSRGVRRSQGPGVSPVSY